MVRKCRVGEFKNLTCQSISRRSLWTRRSQGKTINYIKLYNKCFENEAVDNTGAAIQSSENLVWLRSRQRLSTGWDRINGWDSWNSLMPMVTSVILFWRNANLTKLNFQKLSDVFSSNLYFPFIGRNDSCNGREKDKQKYTSDGICTVETVGFPHDNSDWRVGWMLDDSFLFFFIRKRLQTRITVFLLAILKRKCFFTPAGGGGRCFTVSPVVSGNASSISPGYFR